MDKLLEALKKTSLSSQQVEDVKKAVEGLVSEAAKQIDNKKKSEFDAKLQEAYDQQAVEIAAIEQKAKEGYQQAYAIIEDQRLRLDQTNREWENKMQEGYQQAFEMLESKQSENNDLSLEIHREYDERFKQMRDFMVEKLDQFLQMSQAEIYDEARRDVLNDPKLVEHRVALEKMADIMTDYLQVEGVVNNNSGKVEQVIRENEELRNRLQVVESRNVRISAKNTELTEAVRQKEQLISEARSHAVETERKNRKNSAGNASGRGQRVITESKGALIPEFSTGVTKDDEDHLVESNDLLDQYLKLSGVSDIIEARAKSKKNK